MTKLFLLLLLIPNIIFSSETKDKYAEIANKIYSHATKDSSAWDKLAFMLDNFGHRLSGSENLERTLDWILSEMKSEGLANVGQDPVKVPHWVRNDAILRMTYPWEMDIPVLALGGTIPTPKSGISSELIVVRDKDHLDELGEKVRGKIVLFNRKFDSYGKTVQYRLHGAKWASERGAIASVIRSVSPYYNAHPHTGVMYYSDTIKKIPHAAIPLEHSDIFARLDSGGVIPKVFFYMNPQTLPDADSRNVMGEIVGSELPNEIIAAGGHIDAWDVGQGAHDDGGPCLAVWEAVKLLKDLGLTPRRTIRAVMWTNEENGTAGGNDYAVTHGKEKHHLMFEFDSGVFKPIRLGYTGLDEHFAELKSHEKLFKKLFHPDFEISPGGGGVDIGPMMKAHNVPGMSISGDSGGEYWRYHHSHTDTIDKIDPKDLNENIAAIALALYIYADL
jgi:carboxypeptidase Q